MLAKPDVRTVAAMVRLKQDKDLQSFLTTEVDETLKQMAQQRDEIAFRQMQGKVQYLFELRELIEKSSELAAKMGA